MTLLSPSLQSLLKSRGLVKEDDLAQALRLQKETGGTLAHALIRYGAVSEDALLQVQAEQLNLPLILDIPVESQPFLSSQEMLGLHSSWYEAHHAASWLAEDYIVVVAHDIVNPALREALDRISSQKDLDIRYCLTTTPLLESAHEHFKTERDEFVDLDDDTQRLKELAEEAPVIDLVNRIFAFALKHNASDIHIEPFEKRFQVRYRIDGVLRNNQTEPKSQFDAVVSRVKLLSRMDIAERRLPQDGRQSIRFAGSEIDLRVSSLPGSWGESLVLRLLRKDNTLANLSDLGLNNAAADTFKGLLKHTNGVVLVTGPTGSGKSTTLYRSLQGLNNGVTKIITIEDPVEYDMDGIIQIPINTSIGYTFARGLRAILRQDPDTIMVGEIRDADTATIAAQAALTGHLVLSTLHTNSALAGVARLIDIGLEPYLVASAVRGFAAQRLVRRICRHCSIPEDRTDIDDFLFASIGEGINPRAAMNNKPQYNRALGCPECDNTGYKGRLALFEVAEVTETISDAIFKGANLQQLTRLARENGFISLYEDGLLKARDGFTSVEEVLRVCDGPIR